MPTKSAATPSKAAPSRSKAPRPGRRAHAAPELPPSEDGVVVELEHEDGRPLSERTYTAPPAPPARTVIEVFPDGGGSA